MIAGAFVCASTLPTRAEWAYDCLTGFANVGVANGQGAGIGRARFNLSGGLYCAFGDSDRFGMRHYAAFATFSSSELGGSARFLYAASDFMLVFSHKAHLYGTAGIGAYYKSLSSAPGEIEPHDIQPGYNAGISIAFPIEDGPGIVLETMWHNVRGSGADSFLTLTVGIGGF